MRFAKLLHIRAEQDMDLIPKAKAHWWSKQYWILTAPYHAEFITDDGVWHLDLKPMWITDKRSGSSAVDLVVPKWGNRQFQAVVSAHDCSYSGWMSQEYSDDLFVRQGFAKSGEITQARANLAHKAVSTFGSAYHMEDVMPQPYRNNRDFESLILKDR
jgi:hypothetical protein